MNIPICFAQADRMVRRVHIIHIKWKCVCISYVYPLRLPLAANFCFATNDREECLRLCQGSIGAELVSAHAFLCEICHENEKSFPCAFIAQASVEMDRYRGLCCWYTSITLSLFFWLVLKSVPTRPDHYITTYPQGKTAGLGLGFEC